MTPAQKALLALANHCYGCPTCKPTWQGDTPVHRRCTVADDMARQVLRQNKTGGR